MSDDVEDRVTMTHSVGDEAMSAEHHADVTSAKLTPTWQKDPKKVAAGRAGAAARKAKQERLLEELRAAKQSLRSESDAVHDPLVAKQQQKDPFTKGEDRTMTHSATDTQGQKNWNPMLYTIGIAAGVACVYMFMCHRQDQKSAVTACHPTKKEQSSQPDHRISHLKVSNDPFYME